MEFTRVPNLVIDPIQLASDDLIIGGVDDILTHLAVQQAAGVANIYGGFDFVTSEDPDFDPGLFKTLNRVLHIFLQLVLDRGRADKLHLSFNLCLYLLHELIFVDDGASCIFEPGIPLLIEAVV